MRGSAENFVETFHDDGPTDMAAAMHTYFKIGFSGAMRPDHVPLLDGEAGRADGYSMQGRLFAAGYVKGLMDAKQSRKRRTIGLIVSDSTLISFSERSQKDVAHYG